MRICVNILLLINHTEIKEFGFRKRNVGTKGYI